MIFALKKTRYKAKKMRAGQEGKNHAR